MIPSRQAVAGFIKNNPKKSFLMISLLNGYAVFLSYFIQNNFFPEMDSNLFSIMLMMGIVLTFFLTVIYFISTYFLNRSMVLKEMQSKCNTLFVLSAILWCGVVLPSRAVTFLKLGNYTGTLILKQEGAQMFSGFHKIIIQSKNTIENLHVVWSSGNRWFFQIPADNNQSLLMDINHEFVYSIIKHGKNSASENMHKSFIGD